MAEVEIQHTSSWKSLKKRDIIIADKTGSINLTIWEGAINEIALGKCYKMNKRPTGLNGHLSIRDFTLTSCQRGSYLYYQQDHHRINENQRWYRKAAS